jgi:hypothetical protein
MSTREWIEKEMAAIPEPLQRHVCGRLDGGAVPAEIIRVDRQA